MFKCYNYKPDVPIYFVHCGTKTWKDYKSEGVQLFYAFLNDDTDLNKLSDAINAFINMKLPESLKPVLLIAVNCINGSESILSKRLWIKLGNSGQKGWDIFPIGNGLDDEELNQAFLDFVTKRYNKIKFCRDIMEGNFNGELHV